MVEKIMDERIEIVARALASHRLGRSRLAPQLHSDQARLILERAVDKLSPLLLEEAAAVVEGLDTAAAPQHGAGNQEAGLTEAAISD